MNFGLKGRRAAVAAASSGLGFAAAQALVAEGVQVAVCGRDRGRLDEAVAALGAGAHAVIADVGTPEGATAFVREAEGLLGGIDILVPNAGGPPPGTFASTPLDAYLPALELNLLSVVAMCKAAVPQMQGRGWGRVVAITSLSVRQPIATLILSNTARTGATGFLKTLAREVARGRRHRQLAAARLARHRPAALAVRRRPGPGGRGNPDGQGRRPRGLRGVRGLPVLGAGRLRHRHRDAGGRRRQRGPALRRAR